jgi:hypothetical protein
MSTFTAGRENGAGSHRRPRGYDLIWRPQAKTRALIGQVETVLEEYQDHLPLSVRQIFYRLVATVGYEKTELAYQRLSECLVRARRAKLIPFAAIRDDGERSLWVPWHESPEDFWDETAERMRRYRRDRQAGQQQHIELWCESAGMLDQLERVAGQFSVTAYTSGGFLSLTAVKHIADRACDRNVPTVLLHVGDLDPSGESVFTALAEDTAAFVEADRSIHIQRVEAVRVALTREQVDEHDLPTAPAKASDKRTASWAGETCQLEALAPDVLASIVEEAIRSRMDDAKLAAQIAAEHSERVELLHALPAGTSA